MWRKDKYYVLHGMTLNWWFTTRYTNWDDNLAHTDMDILHRWFYWLITHTNFDQAIIETANGKDYWIHISCRKNLEANRHQDFREMRKQS